MQDAFDGMAPCLLPNVEDLAGWSFFVGWGRGRLKGFEVAQGYQKLPFFVAVLVRLEGITVGKFTLRALSLSS